MFYDTRLSFLREIKHLMAAAHDSSLFIIGLLLLLFKLTMQSFFSDCAYIYPKSPCLPEETSAS